MRRRHFLAGTAAAIITGRTASAAAQAEKWPDRPVKLILPYPPGGSGDLIGRPWAEKLSQAFGQQFVIENRGGAGGVIGVEAAAKSTPDGYTFLQTPNATLSVLPNMRQMPYDPVKSFTPVARVGDLVCGFTIHNGTGIKTFKAFIEYAKANPGKLSFGSAGLGTSSQLRIEMLKHAAGLDILHVPYRGSGDALNDLLAGTVHMMNEINVLPHVQSGKLTLLAINYHERHADYPDVPTLTECGYPGADVPIWFSYWAPAGTPPAIVQKLNAKIAEIAATGDMKARMRSISVMVPIQTPEEMGRFLLEDTKRNGDLIKAANIKLE